MRRDELNFNPFFLFKTAFSQTVMGSILNFTTGLQSTTKYVLLPDQDKLALEITTPKNWKKSDLTVVMVHGLCGSHKSAALNRMAKKLPKKGIRAIRINLRGCGTGKGHTKSTYHSGKTDDIECALKSLKEEYPESPMILMGFSLGGNMVLKLAGELSEKAKDYIVEVMALSPPIDLYLSVLRFEKPENQIYQRYFSKLLRENVNYLRKTVEGFPDIILPKDMSMRDFNNLFVVPFFGFKDVDEYYLTCSAKYFIPEIKVPCKVLLSEDDPLISWESFNEINIPDNVEVYLTKNGGHLGYLGSPKDKRGFYWLDSILLDWILKK